jgi:hypothetical protein
VIFSGGLRLIADQRDRIRGVRQGIPAISLPSVDGQA